MDLDDLDDPYELAARHACQMSRVRIEEPKPSAFELALVAAGLDPLLAKEKPAEAVELARHLISAGQKNIDGPDREDRRFDLEYERAKKLFPNGERVSITEAHELWAKPKGRYKSPGKFTTALREEKLTMEFPINLEEIWLPKALGGKDTRFEEFTSKRAVDELFLRKDERKRKADRVRKRRAQEKRLKKFTRNSEPQKRNSAPERRKKNGKKRNSVSQKRKNRTVSASTAGTA